MDKILHYFQSLGLDFSSSVSIMLVILVGTPVLCLLAKLLFGKKSILGHGIKSAIAILFLCAATVVIQCGNIDLGAFVAPLPFVQIENNQLILFSVQGAHYAALCSQILSLIILVFLVNTAEHLLSKGKRFFSWLFFRFLIVGAAFVLHGIVVSLFNRLLPEGLSTYAPTVLLGILLLMLGFGMLKFLIGMLMGTVNPVIGALYTFFFANLIGKRITVAMVTTILLMVLLVVMTSLGITTLVLSVSALTIYIPFFVALLLLWYLIDSLF